MVSEDSSSLHVVYYYCIGQLLDGFPKLPVIRTTSEGAVPDLLISFKMLNIY